MKTLESFLGCYKFSAESERNIRLAYKKYEGIQDLVSMWGVEQDADERNLLKNEIESAAAEIDSWKFRFGFDIHGVIDTNPEFFSKLTNFLVNTGNEVHVLSGRRANNIKQELDSMGIRYTHIFSIVDYCEAQGAQINWIDKDNPEVDPSAWDRAKAKYAEKHKIQLYLDDSEIYHHYFKTPYARFYSKDKERQKKMKI